MLSSIFSFPKVRALPLAPKRLESAERRTKRKEARTRLATIRIELKGARERRRDAIVAAKEWCRAERVRARDRARLLREKAKADLHEALKQNRENAKAACMERMAAARALVSDVDRARARRDAERQLIRELRDVERDHKAQAKAAPSHDRPETDAEVRAQIGGMPWGIGPLFEQVKGKLKPAPKETRTEALLRYAEKNPEELLAVGGHEHDRAVQQLEAVEKAVAKEAGCSTCTTPSASSPANDYAAKKAARIARLRDRAAKKSAEADVARSRAQTIADRIPFGQPILVGHHSERRHRRDIGKIQGGFKKAMELGDEATRLERRAERAESGRAIASDDPDAIPKLKAKLGELERDRKRMVAANKITRAKSGAERTAALVALGFDATQSAQLIVPDFMGRIGFPDYKFKNTASEVKRIKQRIANLEEAAKAPKRAPELIGDVRLEEADHRVRIVFPSKPSEATRAALKSAGFHWSPQNGAWQRLVSHAAWTHARRIVIEAIGGTPTPPPSPPKPAPSVRASTTASEKKVKGEGLDTAEIASRIREDIKGAVKRGALPKAKYSVRIDRYSMGSSVDVVASELPFPVLNADAFRVRPGETWMSFDSDRFRSRFTPEAERVERALNEIVDAYHWDKSDSSTDYYNERFARHVKLAEPPAEKKRIEAAKLGAVTS
jgi:hypothetical protein